MKIAILGAGSWGTALAVSAALRSRSRRGTQKSRRSASAHVVSLWSRDEQHALAMQRERANPRYLPGIALPAQLEIHAWPRTTSTGTGLVISAAPQLAQQDLVVIATPMAALRSVLEQLRGCGVPVVWLCKGFEQAAPASALDGAGGIGLLAHEVLAQTACDLHAGVLSGPSFALEVARAQPTALVAASSEAAVRQALVDAFHGPALRVYASDDVVGVEVGGAVKNVLAIATGLCDGLQLGLNARAALITRGLHEMTSLGVALGARIETFMGLSGLGDLVLTATGDLSRNRKVGLALAQGQTLEDVVQSLGHVAEGVYCARTVVQRAQQLGIDMPIARAVQALLERRTTPAQAVKDLMEREARAEI
ncbi:MAG: NAD(P)H-dependent glycerol-3-phosphate dehydrogenase [Burkholderiaceae bacterium]